MAEDRRLAPAFVRTLLLAAMASIAAASSSVAAPPPREPSAPVPPVPAPPDVAAPPRDATRTPSGLAYKVLRAGTGTRHAGPTDVVEARFSAWTRTGDLVATTVASEFPAVLPVAQLIPGFREGAMLMVEGELARFWIPKELAYKDGLGGRPSGMLVFDIELLLIQ